MEDKPITDQDLDDAITAFEEEQAVKEEPKETPKEEPAVKEPEKEEPKKEDDIDIKDLIGKELHTLKSDWGRKQSAAEKKIEDLTENVNKLVKFISAQQEATFEGTPIPHTVEELRNVVLGIVDERDKTRQTYDAKYENKYLDTFGKLAGEHESKVAKVLDSVMREKFNVRYSDDPIADAERNYLKAKIYLMERATEKKKNPLKGAKPGTPLGGPSESPSDVRVGEPLVLDDYAADFVKRTGMAEEDVKKALSGSGPSYLMKGKI